MHSKDYLMFFVGDLGSQLFGVWQTWVLNYAASGWQVT
jgi:hypothetical protein